MFKRLTDSCALLRVERCGYHSSWRNNLDVGDAHMSRPGERLQRLVEVIERATNNEPHITVESPKKLPDKDTGRLREHDVVLTHSLSHHTVRIALECRDRSRPVGVPEIEAFAKKCERTGIDKGIMVSSLGFTDTAIKVAAKESIGCLSLTDAEGFDWCLAPGINTSVRRTIHTHITVEPEGDVSLDAELYFEDGRPVDQSALSAIGKNCLSRLSIDHAPTKEPVKSRFVDSAPRFYLLDKEGVKTRVARLLIDVTYEVIDSFVPFEFHQYADQSTGQELYGTATANLEAGKFKGSLVAVNKGDEGTIIMFVPHSTRDGE